MRGRRPIIWLLTVGLAMAVAPATAAPEPSPRGTWTQAATRPAVAYLGPGGDRVHVDDLADGTAREYALRGEPTWSPDGTRLAALEPGGRLVVADVASGQVTELATGVGTLDDATEGPAGWLGDGRVVVTGGRAGLLAVAADGSGRLERIWPPPEYDGPPPLVRGGAHVSPDRRFVHFVACFDDILECDTIVIDQQGTARYGFIYGTPGWLPDSRFAVSALDADDDGIIAVDLDTGQQQRIYDHPGDGPVGPTSLHPVSETGELLFVGPADIAGPVLRTPAGDCCDATPVDQPPMHLITDVTADLRWLAGAERMSVPMVYEVGVGPVELPGAHGGSGHRFAPPPQDGMVPLPPPASDPPTPSPPAQSLFDGDARTVDRLPVAAAAPTAVQLSQLRFPDQQAAHAVIGRADAFPDSLAATPLTGEGPLLYTPTDALDDTTAGELQRVLAPGHVVYLLGGTAALSVAVEQQVTDLGYQPVRLAGSTRISTAVVVAREVARRYGTGATVLLARAGGPGSAAWADSITGGAWAAATGTPLVLTDSARLAPEVDALLTELGTTETILLGGTAALSSTVASAVPGPRRVAGAGREDTAVQIAAELWGPRDRYVLINGAVDTGWLIGLALAGNAAAESVPLLVTNGTGLTAATAAVLDDADDVALVGDEALISADVAAAVSDPPPGAEAIVLRQDGLGVVDFGTDAETAIDLLADLLGQPTADSGWTVGGKPCFFTQERFVSWDDLTVAFGLGNRPFDGMWGYRAGAGYATSTGITGTVSTVGELRQAHPDVRADEPDTEDFGTTFSWTDGTDAGSPSATVLSTGADRDQPEEVIYDITVQACG